MLSIIIKMAILNFSQLTSIFVEFVSPYQLKNQKDSKDNLNLDV